MQILVSYFGMILFLVGMVYCSLVNDSKVDLVTRQVSKAMTEKGALKSDSKVEQTFGNIPQRTRLMQSGLIRSTNHQSSSLARTKVLYLFVDTRDRYVAFYGKIPFFC
mgnify:CR=1 FL=1